MSAFLASPIIHGAITGLVTAAAVDVHAFRSWQSFHDAAVYSWSTAIFRWCQGAICGAIAAAGLGVVLG